MKTSHRIATSSGLEWTGGLLAVGAAIGMWIAVIGGVASPLNDWIGRGRTHQPNGAPAQITTASVPEVGPVRR